MTAPASDIVSVRNLMITEQFDPWFIDWVMSNWRIWERFNAAALKMASTGRSHYSAYTIVEVMRWDSDLSGSAHEQFKINNGAIPRLARLFKLMNPTHANFFNTKPSRFLQA